MRSEFSLLVFIVFACAKTAVPSDGGFDGGADAGRDAGMDAGVDSGADSSRDSGEVEMPDFAALPGLPGHCGGFRVARNPDALSPVTWQPCFDGREHCEEIVVDWGDWSERSTFQTAHDMYSGRGAPRVIFVRAVDASRELVVADESGTVEHAVRWPFDAGGRCFSGAFGAASFDAWKSVLGVAVQGDEELVFCGLRSERA